MTSSRQMIIILFIAAVSCAVILTFVYAFTEPQIVETEKNLTLRYLREVISAKEFKVIIPDTLWQALDSLDNQVGIAFHIFPQGYGGPIPLFVGIDLNRKITSIKIAGPPEGLKETPGLGARIIEPDFTGQFVGKSKEELVIKQDGGEIDAVTSATISSRAVCNGIKKGIELYIGYLPGSIKEDNRKNVFRDADQFIEIIKDTLWYAITGCETLGIVFTGAVMGYLDSIKFMVGLNKKLAITGVEILYSQETEGIGERLREREFLDKFKEAMPEAISGATISSQALINGVKEFLKRYQGYLK